MTKRRLLTAAISLLALVALPGTAHAANSVTIIEGYGTGSAWVKFSYTCAPGTATNAPLVVAAGQSVANASPGVTCDNVSHTVISGTSCLTSCNFRPGNSVWVQVHVGGASDSRNLGLRPPPW
ncbi:hypothetical protein [Actinocrispum wychmicini]|uniref:Neocarzinostatin family protein n=1 Tax=Actinocrispum wychmicini TaxID=1213861 RepID=A0A4R2JRF0_9PSEU|nr:hypothetical protein [Actinocrispum wychmicini]TCO62084.1 hypothetical protein EV192_102221 [Actinocrispum wychmicini]